MKDTHFKKAVHDVKQVTMSDTEKRIMLQRVFDAPALNVSEHARSIKSPWTLYSFVSWVRTHNTISIAIAAILIFVIVGNGVASAAENSLPGDPLYSVKVNVIEPLRVAVASTDLKKAEVQAQLADTRLQEAETLLARGTLDASKQQEIDNLLDSHITAAAHALQNAEKNSPGRADEVRADIQTSLNAHADVLAAASIYATSSASSSLSISEVARGHSQAFARDTKNPNKAIASYDSSSQSFVKKHGGLQSLIDNASSTLNSIGTDTTPIQQEIINGSHKKLDRAVQSLRDADQEQKSGDATGTDSSLQESQKSATEATIFLNAAQKFDKGNDGKRGGKK